MNKIQQQRFLTQFNVILGIIVFATVTRIALPPLVGHFPNFSSIDAIALFCGAYFSRRSIAMLVALLAIWAGDIVLSKLLIGNWILFYTGFYWQYGSYLLITLLGSTLVNRMRPLAMLSSTLASSLLFFAISNFGVWYSGLLYPLTFDGLLTCYTAAIPFFKHTLVSDMLFFTLLFGVYEGIRSKLSHLTYRAESFVR